MNRREFLATSAVTAAGVALRGVSLSGQGQLSTSFVDLRRNVGIFNGQGGTIGWLVNGDGILIIDSQNAAAAQACIDGIRERSSRSIDLLVNTHHHGDHTGGNKDISAGGGIDCGPRKQRDVPTPSCRRAGDRDRPSVPRHHIRRRVADDDWGRDDCGSIPWCGSHEW